MSSTNRSAVRFDDDYYRTPEPPIKDLLNAIAEDGLITIHGGILDPSAGGDPEHRSMPYPSVLERRSPGLKVTTFDIRENSSALHKADFLSLSPLTVRSLCLTPIHTIVTNPPFDLAIQFIQKSLEVLDVGDLVIMLARLNFFGAEKRKAFFASTGPSFTYVHSKRMRFMDKYPVGHPRFGKKPSSDSVEYCHNIWIKGNYPKFSKLRVI
jgi:hypothetical protein